jgi:hypothetical protein
LGPGNNFPLLQEHRLLLEQERQSLHNLILEQSEQAAAERARSVIRQKATVVAMVQNPEVDDDDEEERDVDEIARRLAPKVRR